MRAEKQAVIQKQRKRRTNLRRGGTLAAIAAGIILIVVLIQVSGGSKKAATTTTTTTSTSSTTTTTAPTFAPPTTEPLTTTAVVPTCPKPGNTKRVVWFTKAPPDCISRTSVWDATFETSVGDIKVQMDAAKSYAAVNNFVFLSGWNYYYGTFFHRIIPGFVVQGGDPTGTGNGGPHRYPGYSFTGNYPPKSCKTDATAACYQPGDFVMANSNPNPQVQNASTDGSQFFFVLPGGEKTLNGEPTYTLFGKVVSGLAVVEKIGSYGTGGGTPTTKIYIDKVTLDQVKA
jgi:cyclophilin family peptidyl-prolyl cis-trans isomerase